MIYIGIYFSESNLKITALSEGFAHLATKYFYNMEYEKISQWIAPFKNETDEKCIYFFDDFNFKSYKKMALKLSLSSFSDEAYLVPHRKVINIIQFLYEWALCNEDPLVMDIDPAFILASAIRLFDYNEMKIYE